MESNRSVMSHQDGEKNHLSFGSKSASRYGSITDSLSSLAPAQVQRPAISPTRSKIAVAVLCYINLLNYMERYTIAGVLLNIQNFFDINDSTAGLLQTVFICSFILLAPIFGYLGDRYNRKFIMIGGLSVWLVTATSSSFVTKTYFWFLVLMRALVGTGEASYSTIAPTIIGDLYSGAQRTVMISAFYIFIPVGSGLGYITGSSIATLTGDWRWALRLTPILGTVGLILLIFLCPNPPRGAAETHGEGIVGQSTYLEDVKYLVKNKSFVWSSMGVTAMAFLTGALAFWTPTFLSRAQVTQGIRPPCTKEPCDTSDSYIFGAVTVVTGIIGVCLGTALSRCLRDKVPNADPLICAVGMLGSAPCLFMLIFLASTSIPATYVIIAIGETLLSLNWPILADILLYLSSPIVLDCLETEEITADWKHHQITWKLPGWTWYVVIPTKRASAEALQITVCHLLGDAGSPYLIGAISDAISVYKPDSYEWRFLSLKYSFLICPFIGVLGGLFFLMTALYIAKDRRAVELLVEGNPPPLQASTSEPTMEPSTEAKLETQ